LIGLLPKRLKEYAGGGAVRKKRKRGKKREKRGQN